MIIYIQYNKYIDYRFCCAVQYKLYPYYPYYFLYSPVALIFIYKSMICCKIPSCSGV